MIAPQPRRAGRGPSGRLLQPADLLILATLLLLTALALARHGRVAGAPLLVAKNLAAALLLLAAATLGRKVARPWPAFLLRIAAVSLSYAYLFGAVAPLQGILHDHWLDGEVLALEGRLLGVQPTIWLERFIRPALTEWMMFAYVIYLPLYPLLCGAVFARHGARAAEECFLALGLANVACDLGFILFPVAGPMAYMREAYTVPLDGYLFTWLAELVRSKLHYVGGSLPSPHCAAATVLWAMAWRYRRRLFFALAPIVLTLYVSTFYGRFHYLSDALAGIATALAVLPAASALMRRWERRAG